MNTATATTVNASWVCSWAWGNNPPPPEPPGTAGVPAIVPQPPLAPAAAAMALAAPEGM